MQLCASLPRDLLPTPIFLTLTYWKQWGSTWQAWKENLNTFFDAFFREHEKCGVIWRQDLQRRGAPHFHLLAFMAQQIDFTWLRDSWTRIVHGKLDGAARLRVRVERVRSWNGVMSYAAHYCAKVTQASLAASPLGRQWGVRHRDLLQVKMLKVLLTHEEFEQLRWDMLMAARSRGYDRRMPEGWQGLWDFLPEHQAKALVSACTGLDF